MLSSNTRVERKGQGVAMRNFQGIARVHELSTGHTAKILCNSSQSNCSRAIIQVVLLKGQLCPNVVQQ